MVIQRSETVHRSGIRETFDLATRYKDVVSLGIGEPAYQTPVHIVEAGCKSATGGMQNTPLMLECLS